MARRPTGRARLVYSTDAGDVCPRCGWPRKTCRCAEPRAEAVPERPTARLRIETAGRRGKAVTVVHGLPRNPAFLRELAADLKKACASGGAVGPDRVEIQGDHTDAVRERLRAKGWIVKG